VIKKIVKEMSDTSRYGCDALTDLIPNHLKLNFLEVSIRKVLRPATSTQVFLGFSVSVSEC